MSVPWPNARLVVVDVEGNGQQPPEIVELGALLIDGGELGETFDQLVRPTRPITPLVSRIHGIKNDHVRESPSFSEIASELLQRLEGRVMIAHNANVEATILARALPQWKPAGIIDTLKLAKTRWPGLASYSLTKLRNHPDVRVRLETTSGSEPSPHRAGFDVAVTAELFLALVATYAEVPTISELEAGDDARSDDQGQLF